MSATCCVCACCLPCWQALRCACPWVCGPPCCRGMRVWGAQAPAVPGRGGVDAGSDSRCPVRAGWLPAQPGEGLARARFVEVGVDGDDVRLGAGAHRHICLCGPDHPPAADDFGVSRVDGRVDLCTPGWGAGLARLLVVGERNYSRLLCGRRRGALLLAVVACPSRRPGVEVIGIYHPCYLGERRAASQASISPTNHALQCRRHDANSMCLGLESAPEMSHEALVRATWVHNHTVTALR